MKTRLNLLRLTVFFAAIAAATGIVFAADIPINGREELIKALSAVKPNDVLKLAPGYYGNFGINGEANPQFASLDRVTITASDPTRPPVFEKLALRGVTGLTVSGIHLAYKFHTGDSSELQIFRVENCHKLNIQDSVIDGDNAFGTGIYIDGYGSGTGLGVRDSSDVRIERNRFTNWHRGAWFSNINHLAVVGNEFKGMSSDGLNFAAVRDTVIAGNHLHDFRRSPQSSDHPDMIQFWTANTTIPTQNVEISANFLDQGGGPWTQSIFLGNDLVTSKKAGTEMYFRNIRITGNVIRNSHIHGITVGPTDGLEISNNTLIQTISQRTGTMVKVPMINVAKENVNVTVIGNIVPADMLSKNHPVGWVVDRTGLAQMENPALSNYYAHVFVNALTPGTATIRDLQLLPGSDLAKSSFGAGLSKFDAKPESPVLIISNSRRSTSGDKQKFDAALAFGPSGPIDTTKANVTWDFGDTATGQGLIADHTYAEAGNYEVTATMVLDGKTKLTARRTVHVGMF